MTAPINTISSWDGPRITVNDFIKDPEIIPEFLLNVAAQEFIADAVLRQAGPINSGTIKYFVSTPLYSNEATPPTRAEFAEVEVAATAVGTPKVAFVEEKALAIVVSDEMLRRYDVDPVTRQILQVRNSLTQAWDSQFVNFITAGSTGCNTLVSSTWFQALGTAGGPPITPVYDALSEGIRLIETAQTPQGAFFGYEADTLIINRNQKALLFRMTDFNKIYQGNVADEGIQYRGVLPQQLLGLDVLVSRRIPSGTAIVMQRGVGGFIGDELPLQATALYRDEPRKLWRSDVQRASAIGVDNPKAITVITGIGA